MQAQLFVFRRSLTLRGFMNREGEREDNTKCVSISEGAQRGISIATTSTDV